MENSTEPLALVADDDPLILMDVCDILGEAGFRCHEADSGEQAVERLEICAQEVVLLFSDVEMSGAMNGFALARHVSEHWPWIEIVIASGQVKPEAGDMPEKATFIGKPFSKHMVHDHLRERLPDRVKPEPLRHAV